MTQPAWPKSPNPPPMSSYTPYYHKTSSGLAVKRRAARSSRAFRATIASFTLFCALLFWGSSIFYFGEEESSHSMSMLDASRRDSDASMVVNDDDDDDDDYYYNNNNNNNIDNNNHVKTHMPLRVVSFNIRYATETPVVGEQPWEVRCPKLCAQLRFITAGHENAFISLQEALVSQMTDIQARLGESWSYVGQGRDDGQTKGEFSPIFYRSDVWRCERSETRWLSETPERPSRGWDAALPRIVTMGEFSHRAKGTRVVVMSTHFDHVGIEARKNSARLLIQFAREWSRGKDTSAAVIGGDFNSTPDDGAYKIMTAPGSGMSDVSDLAPIDEHYGNHLTYTSFGEPDEWPKRIDFLFIKEPRTASVRTFGVLANSFDDQIRVSDHRAVVADLDIAV